MSDRVLSKDNFNLTSFDVCDDELLLLLLLLLLPLVFILLVAAAVARSTIDSFDTEGSSNVNLIIVSIRLRKYSISSLENSRVRRKEVVFGMVQ
jgi:hypothetical protein